jgi:Tfp pilus assembly major pilin PilA
MRLAVLAVLSSLFLLSTGCKSSCRQLSEKLCDCTSSTTERTACLQQAANKENATTIVTAEDEATCQGLIAQCDCRLIDTASGKERCGLAVSSDGGL